MTINTFLLYSCDVGAQSLEHQKRLVLFVQWADHLAFFPSLGMGGCLTQRRCKSIVHEPVNKVAAMNSFEVCMVGAIILNPICGRLVSDVYSSLISIY